MLMNRTSVIDAKRDLIKAGFKAEGDDDSWHDVLENMGDAQIASAVNQLKKTGEYKTVRASHVFKAASELSYNGSGGGSGHIEDLEIWVDNDGRDYAWWPGLRGKAHNKDSHRNIIRAEAEEAARLEQGEFP